MGLEDRMKQRWDFSPAASARHSHFMATMVTPKILLLDEHTAALDPATAEKVLHLTRQIVAERQITCSMVTHNMHPGADARQPDIDDERGKHCADVAGEERGDVGG